MSVIGRARGVPEALVVLVTAAWGWTFVLIKQAVADTPVLPFVALRFALAALLLAPLAWRRRARATSRTARRGLLLGSLMFATYALQTGGLVHTSAANSGLITGLYVIATAVLGRVFFGEALPAATGVGIATATTGLGLLAVDAELSFNRGDILTLGCAVTIALHILWAGRLTRGEDSVLLTTIQVAVVAAGAAVLGAPSWPRAFPLPGPTLYALGVCALLATVFAYWVQMEVQKTLSPVRVALLFLLEPAFALLFAVALGGERLAPRQWLGAALVLAGIGLAEGARLRRVAAAVGSG